MTHVQPHTIQESSSFCSLGHRCPKFPLVGWWKKRGKWFTPVKQQVSMMIDGIPVTGPSMFFPKGHQIGLGFQGVDILSDGLQSTAWELGTTRVELVFRLPSVEIVRSWYQSCIHPDMSSHIWCIVLCSSYLCPKSGNQWKLVIEVKVCQKKKT